MRVIVCANNVASFPEGGGHFWVFMQYVQGLRAIGCDVWWMEEFHSCGNPNEDAANIARLLKWLEGCGLQDRLILYTAGGDFLNLAAGRARAIIRDADLLLNFYQKIQTWILERFRRTALVDIDPGLLQCWISNGELSVASHDFYFTTGETVGKPGAKFPDCGLRWIPIRPAVSLDLWPFLPAAADGAFSTVSSWWAGEWVREGEVWYDNNKRAAFLEFVELPRRTGVSLELALNFDAQSASDNADLELLVKKGWRVRHSSDVGSAPDAYRSYIQSSSGEFSCAKASCMKFQNAWISDRTLCYLATGRPAVVQHTGPSSILPNGRGLFRFSTLDEAAAALKEATANYRVHSKAARELAELFDARKVADAILAGCFESAAAGAASTTDSV